ncbi:hypothetical protein F3Y22_tig00116938pilonHSYRG00085 [Hibiscus syriacus]|uniref:Mitochondrial import inner membrane translocase subunit TIM50 n=1 Tax=Hibiscus syriacus TaxID=106335 RepID=A0A6A2Y0T7_HIBSY|nr:hypothetical protein F3Y22_tig00116938pilonHSYRG00085 [Hibiscus syriacus]
MLTLFIRPSGGKYSMLRDSDYWWIPKYKSKAKTAPNITKLIFNTIVYIVTKGTSISTSLPYGCVITHLLNKKEADFPFDSPVRLTRKIDMLFVKKAGYDFVEKVGWKRVKDVELDLEREDNEDDQPMGDAMMEEAAEAPEAQVGQDVTITTVMEYMVNFPEHIDSLVSGMRADISSLRDEVSMLRDELRQRHQTNVDNQAVNEDDNEDDVDDDPNKYIVSATPLARKLVIFYVNGVIVYIPRHPEDVILRNELYEFMQFCLQNFVVSIWSSKMRHNMDCVLDKLRLFSDHFLFVWDQSKCKTEDKFTYCKDLNDVWNEFIDFNALNTLLVDDSPRKMIHNPINNYICPHSFNAASHSDDDALTKGGKIREYLEILLKAPNVPDFVSDNPFRSD